MRLRLFFAAILLVGIAACSDEGPASVTTITRIDPEEEDDNIGTEVGNEAPLFTLLNEINEAVSLEDYRGKVVLLSFWESNCDPCLEDFPDMEEVWANFRNEDFILIGIAVDDERNRWNAVISEPGRDWVQLFADPIDDAQIYADYQIPIVPRKFLLDRQGVVVQDGFIINSFVDRIREEIDKPPVGLDPGDLSPLFTLRDENDNVVALEDFRGKIVLIDFWGSWCSTCIEEIDEIEDVWAEYRDEDFVILAVAVYDTPNEWRAFIEQPNRDWVQVWSDELNDPDIYTDYDLRGRAPHKFLLDREGVVLKRGSVMSQFIDDIPEALGN